MTSVKTLLVKNAVIHSEAVNHRYGVQQEGIERRKKGVEMLVGAYRHFSSPFPLPFQASWDNV